MAPTRLTNVQNFTFKKASDGKYAANWEKDGRRYHVWYYSTKGLDTDLHSNSMDPKVRTYSPQGHRKLNFLSKTWTPMREDVLAHLTGDTIAKADAEYQAAEDKRKEDRAVEQYGQAVTRVNRVLEDQSLDGKSRNVFCALLTLPRDDLLKLL